jgi:hypothetical protein
MCEENERLRSTVCVENEGMCERNGLICKENECMCW